MFVNLVLCRHYLPGNLWIFQKFTLGRGRTVGMYNLHEIVFHTETSIFGMCLETLENTKKVPFLIHHVITSLLNMIYKKRDQNFEQK